jgi:tryptophan synthase alpha chain
MLGYPVEDAFLKVAQVLIDEGVHGLELGLPFRDPVADGPIIQAAANQALDNGFTTSKGIKLVQCIREMSDTIPLTLMCYYNMLIAWGPERFIKEFATAGIDGILIPDLPPERAHEVLPHTKKYGIELVLIASPLSNEHRLSKIAEIGGGFIYVVTRLGITGVSEKYSDDLEALFRRINKIVPLPSIAGFGISEPAQAKIMIKAGARGVITGSKLVQLIDEDFAANRIGDLAVVRDHTKQMLRTLADSAILTNFQPINH